MLWQIDERVLMIAIFLGLLLALEIGFRLGVRRSGRSDESDCTHIGSLLASVLGLLALLLSFTFFMAQSRFDVRKTLVLDEANAIGTAYLRADFLPGDQRDAFCASMWRPASLSMTRGSTGRRSTPPTPVRRVSRTRCGR